MKKRPIVFTTRLETVAAVPEHQPSKYKVRHEMRFQLKATVLFLLSVASQQALADWPGIQEVPAGFNNLPFSIPTGEAHWCYDVRKELRPVSREEASFFFEGQKDYLASLLVGSRSKMFRLPNADVAVVARNGCGDVCKIDIAIRSSYNLELYKDLSLEKAARVEVYPAGGDWTVSSSFEMVVHGVRRSDIKAAFDARHSGVKEAFVYLTSRSVDRSKATDSLEYGFKPDKFNGCFER